MRVALAFIACSLLIASGLAGLPHGAGAASAPIGPASHATPHSPAPGIIGVIEIVVHNSGSSPTGVYDQQVVLNSKQYAAWLNANFSNVLATYAVSGTPIYGWIESGASNTSSNTTLWLRLGSIAAGGTAYLALDCLTKSYFGLSESGWMGESPLLSPAYAEFDNGWRVFNFYDNFSGSSLSAAWAVNGSWTTSVDHGFQVSAVPGTGANITSRQSFPFPEAVDFYGDPFQTAAATAYIVEGLGVSACSSCGTANSAAWDAQGSSAGPTPYSALGNSQNLGSPVFSSPQFAVFTVEENAADSVGFQLNYTNVTSWSGLAPLSPQPVALALSGDPSGSLTNTQTTYWIRERSPLPVMPTALNVPEPAITTEALPSTLAVGQSLELTSTVMGGSTPFRFGYTGLPPGCASLNASVLSCLVSTAGQYLVGVTVTDAAGLSVTGEVNVTVTSSTSQSPLGASLVAAPASVTTGGSLTFATLVTGGFGPYTFVYSGLPAGCHSVNRASFDCSPTEIGQFPVLVHVTDAPGDSANASANVTVTSGVSSTPATTSTALPAWEVGAFFGGLALALVLSTAAIFLAVRGRRAD
jgi:hypothetical protein